MILLRQIVFLFVSCSINLHLCHAALPTTEALGQLMGYPQSELLIEDNTSQERTLIRTPSWREQSRKTVLPDPAILLKAYLIHGKNENSFFPVQIYIGVKDAFLTPEVLDLLIKGDTQPVNQRISGTEGFASVGRGGMYLTQYHKIKSDLPPLKLPRHVAAAITVIQPRGEDFDVRIAWRADLGQGQELQPVSGGEAYYNAFGPSSEQKVVSQLDATKIFLELNKIVITEWMAERSASGVASSEHPLTSQLTTPAATPDSALNSEAPASSLFERFWWLGILALVALVFIANALRKRVR